MQATCILRKRQLVSAPDHQRGTLTHASRGAALPRTLSFLHINGMLGRLIQRWLGTERAVAVVNHVIYIFRYRLQFVIMITISPPCNI